MSDEPLTTEQTSRNGHHADEAGQVRAMLWALRLQADETDLGNANRFALEHQEIVRYVPGLGWHVWDQRRFAADVDGAAGRLAAESVRKIKTEAGEIVDEKEAKRRFAWALKSQSRRALEAMAYLAQNDERLIVPVEALDADPWLMTCANGTLDLRTATLRACDPADLITRATDVAYRADAPCPRWEQFLTEVFADDAELIGFVQRWMGYVLTGCTREHILAVLWGTGGNGKSTLIRVLERLLGELAATAAFETFLRSRADRDKAHDLARLRGARLVVAAESGKGRRLDENIVKQATGGDTITARAMYKDFFEYRPTFKLALVTNHRPQVDASDEAVWRRLRLIPFEQSFIGREDRGLETALQRELPGILAWAVQGALAWQRDGLRAPEAVRVATASYRADSDPLGDWIEERVTLDADARLARTAARADYEAFCQRHRAPPLGARDFADALRAHGAQDGGKMAGIRYWRGLRLSTPPEERGT